MSTNDWFHDFFSGAAVDFWVDVAPSPDDDVTFLQSVFGSANGQKILDLACGAGRHTIPLARAGYAMTGVDRSPEFLERARAAASMCGAAIDWQERDMRDLPWPDAFDGVLCFGNSFGYLGRAGTADCVSAIASAMKGGAAFVLDMGSVAESLFPALQQRRWMEVNDILFLSSSSYHVLESRLDVEYTFVRGSLREKKTAHTWIFTVAELREMLETRGLEVEGAYASPQREPFAFGAPRLLLVARKR